MKSGSHKDPKTGRYTNRRPHLMDEMSKPSRQLKMAKAFFLAKEPQRAPLLPLPEVKPDLGEFLRNDGHRYKYIWLGHSTFLVNFEGKILLFDPVFHNASPVAITGKRFQPPVISMDELPNIDLIVLSHDHYDHLDSKAMKFFADKKMRIVTALGVGKRLQDFGIAADRIVEMDWWQEHQELGLTFACTPSQHFSGRTLTDRNKTLWCSFAIFSPTHRMYFSGDSGYDTHFADIGAKYGPFDICFMENGQYNELWRPVHMLPEEAVQAQIDLKGKRLMPIHWGMFVLSIHSWFEPAERISQAAKEKSMNLFTPKIGQIVDIDQPPVFEAWWKKV
jgi:L-ascorbate metabolism protein UlaG (beta-lactamase superfamily)